MSEFGPIIFGAFFIGTVLSAALLVIRLKFREIRGLLERCAHEAEDANVTLTNIAVRFDNLERTRRKRKPKRLDAH